MKPFPVNSDEGYERHITITSEDFAPLTAEIPITITREKGQYWAANEQFGIFLRSKSFKTIRQDVVEDLDFQVDSYIVQKRGVSPQYQATVDTLAKIIDITKCKPPHWAIDRADGFMKDFGPDSSVQVLHQSIKWVQSRITSMLPALSLQMTITVIIATLYFTATYGWSEPVGVIIVSGLFYWSLNDVLLISGLFSQLPGAIWIALVIRRYREIKRNLRTYQEE